MAFVDELRIRAKAGKGGDGVVQWLHEKSKEFGGPVGGDGGRGGDVIFRAVRDVNTLARYRGKNEFRAEKGDDGKGKNMAGKDGESVFIDVPVGSVVTRLESGHTFELLNENDTVVGLHGGRGGLGNANFKSSTNQYPTESTEGAEGEEDEFLIEVKLIADAGLIGLPNAGKSSLLNALTSAKAKVGSYAFTTLEPNLGVFYGYVLADIPGLIEGAHEGRGLGDAFLRHISRTRALIHCVPADSADPRADYETVRNEIAKYDTELSRKAEIVFVTKADSVSEEKLTEVIALFSTEAVAVSVIDDASLKRAGDRLAAFLREN